MIERYVQWMLRDGGAPSRYAVYLQLIQGIGLISMLIILILILRDQLGGKL